MESETIWIPSCRSSRRSARKPILRRFWLPGGLGSDGRSESHSSLCGQSGGVISALRGSQLFTFVPDSQFELPTLKGHQHAAKLVPVDFPTVDNEKWHPAIAGIVPLNPSTHHSFVRDLQSVLTVFEMFGGKGTPHFFDQPTEQNQQVLLRIADDLEVVARWMSIAKLESVERDSGTEQIGTKVKLADFSRGINETHRLELGVFESCQPSRFRHFLIEALATKMSIPAFNGTVIDDVIVRCRPGATIAASFPASRRLSLMIQVQ
jgi:hypothetical protein